MVAALPAMALRYHGCRHGRRAPRNGPPPPRAGLRRHGRGEEGSREGVARQIGGGRGCGGRRGQIGRAGEEQEKRAGGENEERRKKRKKRKRKRKRGEKKNW